MTMEQILTALKEVSSLHLGEGTASARPACWLRVVLRALLGLVCGLLGGLILWLIPGDRAVGTLLATLAVVGLRACLAHPSDKNAFLDLSADFAPVDLETKAPNQFFRQAIFNILLLVRPLCLYFILLHHNFLWLCAAAALAQAIRIDEETAPENRRPVALHWLAATVITLAVGAFASKVIDGQQSMFILSVIAVILCWLFPYMLDRLCAHRTPAAMLYLGETAALVLGLLGQAL
ncbi:MAG: hypothetical protein IJJ33_12440 [Victivallales bacterium]|nr:hypothetical protein [Victivallales bacterium]